jgi:predicted regulator of Ras-like GTPase activity (Roadblock/LC7/MglB family)
MGQNINPLLENIMTLIQNMENTISQVNATIVVTNETLTQAQTIMSGIQSNDHFTVSSSSPTPAIGRFI